jgi:mRNA-degrading endonuclease RelE of RelBE toxin-antitoxin system
MTIPFEKVEKTPEFNRDLKKLLKRYRTLEEDIRNLIKFGIGAFHKLGIDSGGIFRLAGLGFEEPRVFKVKKFACRSLRGTGSRSGMRLIYAYYESEDCVLLIELYYKGDRENEDRERIVRCCVQSQGDG